jgi:peroxiredoxin
MKAIITGLVILVSQYALALEVGDVAPAVTLKQLNYGIESEVSVQVGSKAGQNVLLEFFQTNCSYCRENFPNVVAAEKEAGDKAVIRHIGIDRSEADLRKFADEHSDVSVVLDNNRLAKKAYEIRGTPTTYIIDASGKIVYHHEGVWEDSEKVKIRELLAH